MANFSATVASPTVLLALRGAQFAMAVILLGLSATLVSDINDDLGVPVSVGEFSYAVFDSVWMILAVPYLGYAAFNARGDHAMPAALHPIGVFVVEILSHIFIFSAWIANASVDGELGCGGLPGECGLLTAYSVLGALTWLFLWIPTTVLVVLSSVRGGHFKHGATTSTTTTGAPLTETAPATTTTTAAPAAATTGPTHHAEHKTETEPVHNPTLAPPNAGSHEVDGTSSPNGATGTHTTTSTGNYPGV